MVYLIFLWGTFFILGSKPYILLLQRTLETSLYGIIIIFVLENMFYFITLCTLKMELGMRQICSIHFHIIRLNRNWIEILFPLRYTGVWWIAFLGFGETLVVVYVNFQIVILYGLKSSPSHIIVLISIQHLHKGSSYWAYGSQKVGKIVNCNWKKIWRMPWSSLRETQLSDFQFRLLHKIFATKITCSNE